MIPHHTVDVTRLDRGFVITNPESIAMDCDEPWHDSWVVDVSDPTHPRMLARMPRPQAPRPHDRLLTLCADQNAVRSRDGLMARTPSQVKG
jgi:hypothetical protein